MKTKELIRKLFVSDVLRGAERRKALETLISKLKRKEEKLRQKLKETSSAKAKRKIKAKLKVNAMHQEKAQEVKSDLTELGAPPRSIP